MKNDKSGSLLALLADFIFIVRMHENERIFGS